MGIFNRNWVTARRSSFLRLFQKILEKTEKKTCISAQSVLILSGMEKIRGRLPFYDDKKEVNVMKEGIHPKYEQTTIRCACGEVIATGSTKKDIKVEICSKCHPFYTGKQKLVDTGGRVDRFNKKFGLK